MDILAKLFGNDARVKLLRYFLLNERKPHTLFDLEKRTGLSANEIKKEGEHLKKCGVLRIKSVYIAQSKKLRKNKKVRTLSYSFNSEFKHTSALKNLFIATNPISTGMVVSRLNRAGRVKLVIVSGIFLENPDSRLDILIVGDRLDKVAVDRAMHSFERALGKELRYAMLETQDFAYRISVFDRLVRDVLDYPHQKLLNKLGL